MAFMQLPQWLARFNRYVTNAVQRMWACLAPTMGPSSMSTGGGRMRRYGKTIELTDPRVVPRSQAAPPAPPLPSAPSKDTSSVRPDAWQPTPRKQLIAMLRG